MNAHRSMKRDDAHFRLRINSIGEFPELTSKPMKMTNTHNSEMTGDTSVKPLNAIIPADECSVVKPEKVSKKKRAQPSILHYFSKL